MPQALAQWGPSTTYKGGSNVLLACIKETAFKLGRNQAAQDHKHLVEQLTEFGEL